MGRETQKREKSFTDNITRLIPLPNRAPPRAGDPPENAPARLAAAQQKAPNLRPAVATSAPSQTTDFSPASLLRYLLNWGLDAFFSLPSSEIRAMGLRDELAAHQGIGGASAMAVALHWAHGVDSHYNIADAQIELGLFTSEQRDKWALLAGTILTSIECRQLSMAEGVAYLRAGYRQIVRPRLAGECPLIFSGQQASSPAQQHAPGQMADQATILFPWDSSRSEKAAAPEPGAHAAPGEARDQARAPDPDSAYTNDGEIADIVLPLSAAGALQRDLIYHLELSCGENDRRCANEERREIVQRVIDSIALSESGVYYLEFLSNDANISARVTIVHRHGCQNIYADERGRPKMIAQNMSSQRGYLLGKTSAHFAVVRVSGIGFATDVLKAQMPFSDVMDAFSATAETQFRARLEALTGGNGEQVEGEIIRGAEPLTSLQSGIDRVSGGGGKKSGPYLLIRVARDGSAQPLVLTRKGIYDERGRERLHIASGKWRLPLRDKPLKRWYLTAINDAVGTLSAHLCGPQLLSKSATARAVYSLFSSTKAFTTSTLLEDLTHWIEGGYFAPSDTPEWVDCAADLMCSLDIAALMLYLPDIAALRKFLQRHVPKLRSRASRRIEIVERVKQVVKQFGPDRLWAASPRDNEVKAVLEWVEQGFIVNDEALELARQSEADFYNALGMVARRCGFGDIESLKKVLRAKLPALLLQKKSVVNPVKIIDSLDRLSDRGTDEIEITDADFIETLALIGIKIHSIDLYARDLRALDLSPLAYVGARLNRLNLSNADLSGVNFTGICMQQADFSHSNLESTCCIKVQASQANFSASSIDNVDFSAANLQNAIFHQASLAGADFSGADLRGADFTDADLRGANFSEAIVDDADFTGALLEDSILPLGGLE